MSGVYDQAVIGRNEAGTLNASPTAVFSAAADIGNVDLYNASAATLDQATIHGTVTAHDFSVVTVNAFSYGATLGALVARDNSQVLLNGGNYGFASRAYDNASVVYNNGYGGSLEAYEGGSLYIKGGQPGSVYADGGKIFLRGGSVFGISANQSDIDISGGVTQSVTGGSNRIRVSGGQINSVNAYYNDTVSISGGSVGSLFQEFGKAEITGGVTQSVSANGSLLTVRGGEIVGLESVYYAKTDILGGDIGRVLAGYGGQAAISGGTVRNVISLYNGHVYITGGQIGGVDPDITDYDSVGVFLVGGEATFYGSQLSYFDPVPGNFVYYSGTYYTLKGRLQDGSFVNTTLFLTDGSTLTLVDVPEPGAVAFGLVAGLSLLGAMRRGRRSRIA